MVFENFMSSVVKSNLTEINGNDCPKLDLTSEVFEYVNKFPTSEALLRSGGLPIEMLDRWAFGFSVDDIKVLMPNELNIKWRDDLENVKYEISHSKLSKKNWAADVNLSKPIEVSYKDGKFYIEDGHHRYYAAKILSKPLNIDLTIKSNPMGVLAPSLSYDNFHRCIFDQVKSLNESLKSDDSSKSDDGSLFSVGGRLATKDEFKDALLDLATLSLEDDQVRYPNFSNRKSVEIFYGSDYDLYLYDHNTFPSSGPFELSIRDNDGGAIGFIRGTISDKTIKFNLIHIMESSRGQGIGLDIYEKFLDMGYIIKSDSEITDGTYSIYDKLLSKGYKPIIYDDKRVGLVKK